MQSNTQAECLVLCSLCGLQVESLSKQVKQLEDTLRITTKEYILGEFIVLTLS